MYEEADATDKKLPNKEKWFLAAKYDRDASSHGDVGRFCSSERNWIELWLNFSHGFHIKRICWKSTLPVPVLSSVSLRHRMLSLIYRSRSTGCTDTSGRADVFIFCLLYQWNKNVHHFWECDHGEHVAAEWIQTRDLPIQTPRSTSFLVVVFTPECYSSKFSSSRTEYLHRYPNWTISPSVLRWFG